MGKTLSARRYAAWDRFEALPSVWHADDDALATFGTADTVFYTPQVVNSSGAVADGIRHLCVSLRSIRDEPPRRAENIAAKARAREEERKRQELLLEADWFAPPPPPADESPSIPQAAAPGPRSVAAEAGHSVAGALRLGLLNPGAALRCSPSAGRASAGCSSRRCGSGALSEVSEAVTK